jgi:hypothetical protein
MFCGITEQWWSEPVCFEQLVLCSVRHSYSNWIS